MAKAIALRSFGCRTNQEEIATLGFRLAEKGHRLVDTINEAQILVVNTCSVTSGTEAKTRRFLRQLFRQAPHIAVCVTGCLAQQKADELKREPCVRWVVGNACKNKIPEIVENEKEGIFYESFSSTRLPLRIFPDSPICFDMNRRTRFSIKIQEGCDFRCAYCIVPLLRGRSISASMADIVTICKRAIDTGFKEIVLTGTHIGQYHDTSGAGLLSLLERCLAVTGDFRIRLSSLDPADLSKTLVDLIHSDSRLCRHIHVSVQSLSPDVLVAMNRPFTKIDSLIEMLGNFRKRSPDAGIGGDFIVGFPGESDGNFEETVANVEKIGFSYGHVFRFSKRPMTAAATLTGQIDEMEKKRRSARLRTTLDRCLYTFVNKLIGTTHEIVVEMENPITGRTSNYLRVNVPGASARRNTWCRATIVGFNPATGHCCAALSDRRNNEPSNH